MSFKQTLANKSSNNRLLFWRFGRNAMNHRQRQSLSYWLLCLPKTTSKNRPTQPEKGWAVQECTTGSGWVHTAQNIHWWCREEQSIASKSLFYVSPWFFGKCNVVPLNGWFLMLSFPFIILLDDYLCRSYNSLQHFVMCPFSICNANSRITCIKF